MQDCKPIGISMNLYMKLFKAIEDNNKVDSSKYQQNTGSIMYAMLGTRSDIAFATRFLARFNLNLTAAHWTAAKQVLRYLQGTIYHGITYGLNNNGSITRYTGSKWVGDSDDQRSTAGYMFTLHRRAIS